MASSSDIRRAVTDAASDEVTIGIVRDKKAMELKAKDRAAGEGAAGRRGEQCRAPGCGVEESCRMLIQRPPLACPSQASRFRADRLLVGQRHQRRQAARRR